MKLYEAPIFIAGYATRFGLNARGEPLAMRFVPGCFMLAGRAVTARFEHERAQAFGDTLSGALRLFQDSAGLGFRLAVPGTWNALGLVRQIRANVFRECSIAVPTVGIYAADRIVGVEVVRRATITDISICCAGAMPGTGVWVESEPDEALSPQLLALRNSWRAGWAAANTPRPKVAGVRRITASARRQSRPPRHLLDQIDRLLAGRVSNAAAIPSVPAGVGRDQARLPEFVGQTAGRGASSGRKGWEAGNLSPRRP